MSFPIPQDSPTSQIQLENNQTGKTGCKHCLKSEVGGSAALSELSQQSPGKHLHRAAPSCEAHSWYRPTWIPLNSSALQAGCRGNKAAPVRGAQDGEQHCRMLYKHRGVWPGRSRGQAAEVLDCRMHKPRDSSCSLPVTAHVSHSVKSGLRAGGEEMKLKVVMSLVQG